VQLRVLITPQKAEVIDDRTYLRFLPGISFLDIAVGLANDSDPDIDSHYAFPEYLS
jgi:hypothetical protein